MVDNLTVEDIADPQQTGRPHAERVESTTYRILRDTPLARAIKALHKNRCQLCSQTLLLYGGQSYAEAHHIQPLGSKHNGPDKASNILCVCPNCHAQLDYGAIPLNTARLCIVPGHLIDERYVEYHILHVYKGAK